MERVKDLLKHHTTLCGTTFNKIDLEVIARQTDYILFDDNPPVEEWVRVGADLILQQISETPKYKFHVCGVGMVGYGITVDVFRLNKEKGLHVKYLANIDWNILSIILCEELPKLLKEN